MARMLELKPLVIVRLLLTSFVLNPLLDKLVLTTSPGEVLVRFL